MILALSVACAGVGFGLATGGAAAATASAPNQQKKNGATETSAKDLVAAGEYLATAGDCHACHTRPGGPPFAGGTPINTPFGTIYTTNLTPDRATGIGNWSDEDFYHAFHDGHGPNGKLYYPAFPYVFFSKVTKKDAFAIKAYLASLKPVHYVPPPNALHWPFNYRFLLYFWRTLFFTPGTFHPDPTRSAIYNRGAYLVEGLGHCGACHTPRNVMGAIEPEKALTGAEIDGWYAPDISPDKQSTIRNMTIADIATFLHTGAAKPQESGFGPQTTVLGPMAEVVHKSLSHLTEQDLTAIATYLKQGRGPAGQQNNQHKGQAVALSKGEQIYMANCSACHGQSGQGLAPYVPALRNNSVVQLKSPLNVVRTILEGSPTSPAERYSPMATMPAFGTVLKDNEIAAVATYIRSHWQNKASSVEPSQVKALRK